MVSGLKTRMGTFRTFVSLCFQLHACLKSYTREDENSYTKKETALPTIPGFIQCQSGWLLLVVQATLLSFCFSGFDFWGGCDCAVSILGSCDCIIEVDTPTARIVVKYIIPRNESF